MENSETKNGNQTTIDSLEVTVQVIKRRLPYWVRTKTHRWLIDQKNEKQADTRIIKEIIEVAEKDRQECLWIGIV